MCGIAGRIDFSGGNVPQNCIQKMTDPIAHRGPDGEGQYVDGNVGLGHRRLSIIDLTEKASQPMVWGKDFVITYNGEVYNYRELRAELERMGYVFQSDSDTEVVLASYAAWGEKCVYRFNGMFAFAIWDKRKRMLFLARDRYGVKPLYYAMDSQKFLFASEQRAILSDSSISRELDLEALLEYFTFQNIFTDKTFNKNIKMFPAGCYAYIHADELRPVQIERYWDFDFREPDSEQREEEYVEELDRLFRQAVQRQLVSDVDVGSYLSGGMDSGSITAIAAKSLPYLTTFTCGFDLHSASGLELGFDEREKSEYMSYLFKTEHYEMVLKSGDMERVLPDVVNHLEEPRVGQSYPNYYAAKLASKFVKVVLSGAGSDELFGGYPWRYYRAAVNDNFDDYIDKYYAFWQRLIPNKKVKEVFAPIWPEVKHIWTKDIFRDVVDGKRTLKTERPEDYINNSLYLEAKTFLHGLLVVEDKLSMAHSLETRVPFLDNDLVDFAIRLPMKYKLKNLREVVKINENEMGGKKNIYYQKTKDGKLLLRKVMDRYMPKEITEAVKQGFSAPDASWFKGDSIEFVKRVLGKNAAIYDYMDYGAVNSLVNEHMEGRQNRRLFIWSLLNFEIILQEGIVP